MPRLLLLLAATAHAFVAPRPHFRKQITLQADTSARVVDAVVIVTHDIGRVRVPVLLVSPPRAR